MFADIDSKLFTIILFVVAVAAIRLRSDIQEIIAIRRLRQLNIKASAKEKTPRISILIEQHRSSKNIMPLIDHLYGHGYKNLEVIVIIKPSASKHTQAELMTHRQKNKLKLFKIIKQTNTLTKDMIIRKRVTGNLIVALAENTRLPNGFFNRITTEFLDREVDIIMPREHIASETTLISALRVMQHNWRNIGIRINKSNAFVKGVQPGYVYRTETLLRRHTLKSTAPYNPSFTTALEIYSDSSWTVLKQASQQSVRQFFISSNEKIIATALICFAVFFVTMNADYDHVLLVWLLLASCVSLYALFILGIKEYTIMQRVAHALFAPFGIVTFAFIYATAGFALGWKSGKKTGAAFIRKLLPQKAN
jgi:hypothetical protein